MQFISSIRSDCVARRVLERTITVPCKLSPRCPARLCAYWLRSGSQVEAGAGIVVVEAMKMQNEMKSPKAGVVTSLSAIAGATVNAGDVLAEIE